MVNILLLKIYKHFINVKEKNANKKEKRKTINIKENMHNEETNVFI